MLIYYLVTTLHVLVCFILILVVLLQSGKGADIAGAFGGGGSQTAFGSRGPASFLSKLTSVAATVFMITCLSLSLITTKREAKSVMDSAKGKPVPVSKAPAAKSTAPAPTTEQIRQQQEEIENRLRQKAQPAPQAAQPGTASAPAGNAQPQAKPEAAKESKPPAEKKP